MNEINIDYLRRIENFTELENTLPKVGFPAENHIDDIWDNEAIYKGELYININTGHLYTSNGQEIIALNIPRNYIIDGLEIKRPITAGQGIALDIDIEDGHAIINNKMCKFTSSDISNVNEYTIDLNGTDATTNKFVLIYAEPETLFSTQIQENSYLDIVFSQEIIEGTNTFQENPNLPNINNSDIINSLFNAENNTKLLLGIIFIPPAYTETSLNIIEPISLSTKYASFPLMEKSKNQLLFDDIKRIKDWGTYRVFYKSQIIKDKNVLYLVHQTFGNSAEIDISKFVYNSSPVIPIDSASDTVPNIDSDSGSDFYPNTETYINKCISIITDTNVSTDNTENEIYWVRLNNGKKLPTNENPYKYIIGTIPNIDPTGTNDLETITLPEVYVNGVKFTVGYNNTNKDIAHVYFAKINTYIPFDMDNYVESELNNLDFKSNVKEGYYLIWNKENINYDFFDTKFDVVIYYKI